MSSLAPIALFLAFALGLWLAIHYLVPAARAGLVASWRGARRLVSRNPRFVTLGERLDRRFGKYRTYLPVLLIVGAGAIVSFAAADVFTDIAGSLREDSALARAADSWFWTTSRLYHSSGATWFFTFFTILGTPVALGAIVLVVAATLLARGRARWAFYLAGTSLVGGLLNSALKAYFVRQRPDLAEAIRQASGYSFPSGHAMGSTIVFGALTYLALRHFRDWHERSATMAIAISTVLAISLSRIYLGVHWITDVVAGIAAGLVWVIFATVAYEASRRVRKVRARRNSTG
ncbi:MAG TPA: phosphatase PAP2 family protein [Thermoanaerobaculia bacterium]